MEPKVSIILVNFNGFTDTKECIESLLSITYLNYEVIVVDNCSTITPNYETLAYIKESAIYIEAGDNLGFSGGNNIGINYAIKKGTDYILLLNNDTTVEPNFLNKLVSVAENYVDTGIVGGKIRFYNAPDRLWFGGGSFNIETGKTVHERYDALDIQVKQKIREISFMTGCLMLIPVEVIMKTGLFNEDYFLYSEDTDYCCRVINSGKKIYYCEDAIIYHKVSSSSGVKSITSSYYMTRNNLWIIKQYTKQPALLIVKSHWQSMKDIVSGRKSLKPVIEAYWDFYMNRIGKK